MVRGVNGETTGGLLACEGPMGVQLPWSMARLTGEVRPEKPWKWEISSPLQLEPWPQAEMVYCIMYQRDVHYLTVNTHKSPKNRNWPVWMCAYSQENTQTRAFSCSRMCKACDLYRRRQRKSGRGREMPWGRLTGPCHPGGVRTCRGPGAALSSGWTCLHTDLQEEPSTPPFSHLHHVKPTPISTTNSYPPSHKRLLNFDAAS